MKKTSLLYKLALLTLSSSLLPSGAFASSTCHANIYNNTDPFIFQFNPTKGDVHFDPNVCGVVNGPCIEPTKVKLAIDYTTSDGGEIKGTGTATDLYTGQVTNFYYANYTESSAVLHCPTLTVTNSSADNGGVFEGNDPERGDITLNNE